MWQDRPMSKLMFLSCLHTMGVVLRNHLKMARLRRTRDLMILVRKCFTALDQTVILLQFAIRNASCKGKRFVSLL